MAAPTMRMWPPTQSMAAVPMIDRALSNFGIPSTRRRPTRCDEGSFSLGEAQADVVHLHDEGDDAVDDPSDHEGDDDEDDRPCDDASRREPP